MLPTKPIGSLRTWLVSHGAVRTMPLAIDVQQRGALFLSFGNSDSEGEDASLR